MGRGLFTPILEPMFYEKQLPKMREMGIRLYKSKYKCTICNKKWEWQYLGAYVCSSDCMIKVREFLKQYYLKPKEEK
ncbi:hypothetical protein [Spiroplasma endosymbiont of Villa modesta]|uniref:hypothetical protein n=1 Tax=Spiroplasma endosymbiont of Villa modesta TaxID=3066293 RepID=UPI00313DD77A